MTFWQEPAEPYYPLPRDQIDWADERPDDEECEPLDDLTLERAI